VNPPVILVPGIGDNERKLRVFVPWLEKAGRTAVAIAPQPSDGTAPIEALADLLAAGIDKAIGQESQIDLFGFSMGGIVCRYYLQRLGGLARTRRFVTLASPHRGTWMALRYPTRPAPRQMRHHSAFLENLNAELHLLEQVDFTSMWTPLDLTILPASNSALPVGRSVRVLSPFHSTLLYDTGVLRKATAFLNGDGGG